MAGYYKAVLKAPLVIQPVNLMEDRVPLEFDMTLAVPETPPGDQGRDRRRDSNQRAQRDPPDPHRFGVADGQVRGLHRLSRDLPSHGPYKPDVAPAQTAAERAKVRKARMAELKKWLAEGAESDDELHDAIVRG